MILLSYPCFFSSFQDKFNERIYLLHHKGIEEQVKNSRLVIFTGGEDLNPLRYKEKSIDSYYNDERDILEYELMGFALKHRKPILGTCRGLQLINVFFGGTLHQNITWNHTQIEFEWYSKTLKSLFPFTNSMHHQGIKELAPDFYSLGNTRDKLIEAIFCPRLRILGFQFHPELIKSDFWMKMLNPEIFYDLLEEENAKT